MKAWILHGVGDIRYEDADMPQPKAGEVIVAVKAAGICGSDIPRIYETGAHIHPLVPGHEFAGQVTEVGEGVDTKWKNKRVGIFPLIPCGNCTACQNRYYELCRSYSYLGSRRDGGFAEYAAVPEWNLIELPDSVSYEEAAMLEPMAVAVHAMRRVQLRKNDTVVILGLGTIGMLFLMFLKDAGVESILAVGNKEFQRKTALGLGLDESCYCDSKTQNVSGWIMQHTNQTGADVFFECVGRNETFSQAVDLTAPTGRICLVGNPYSDMTLEKSVYWKILRNQLTITGTWNSSFTHEKDDDWNYVLERLMKKRILPKKLISHQLELHEAESGFLTMRDKREDYMKVMIY
ncbi:galactitol-1-phosphate 5-dehydrogenase [Lachnospiraceae bacterium MD335]|nr:galactitol-1-phosphate 5-dehydrogenase [Lachnospiraceae bacterium MD335]